MGPCSKDFFWTKMGPMSKDFGEKVTHLGSTSPYALTCEYPPCIFHVAKVECTYCSFRGDLKCHFSFSQWSIFRDILICVVVCNIHLQILSFCGNTVMKVDYAGNLILRIWWKVQMRKIRYCSKIVNFILITMVNFKFLRNQVATKLAIISNSQINLPQN